MRENKTNGKKVGAAREGTGRKRGEEEERKENRAEEGEEYSTAPTVQRVHFKQFNLEFQAGKQEERNFEVLLFLFPKNV